MYVLGVDHVYDMHFNGQPEGEGASPMATSSGRPSRNTPATISSTPTPRCCSSTSRMPRPSARRCWRRARRTAAHALAHPAYDQCIKACHLFNLLDARGVISVTERQAYILRVRELAKGCCEAWSKHGGRRRRLISPQSRRVVLPANDWKDAQHDRRPHCPEDADPRRGRGRKGLLVVRLRPVQAPALLRRQPQGHRLHAREVDRRGLGPQVLLRLQADQGRPFCDGSHKAL